MPPVPPDFLLSGYRYELPEERIAQAPAPERDASRLLLLDKKSGATRRAAFADLLDFLPPRALLVANNSRVVPARLTALRSGGGASELLLLTPPPLLVAAAETTGPDRFAAEAEILLRPAKKSRPGDVLEAAGVSARVLEQGDFGRCRARLAWQGDLRALLEREGALPLPPYIKRGDTQGRDALDRERYQTSYARSDKAGSVAAPTAGLHFTPTLLQALADSGREWAELTLYVGYGTFSPVRCRDIREHPMHAEYVEISEECAGAVSRARAEGRPVIAVGTTSARSLEGAFALQGGAGREPMAPFSGWIDIFLYPGRPFKVIDGLITNFHLPESSLLMLVSALAGRERVLAAYREALEAGFRFFSYGDAMLIL